MYEPDEGSMYEVTISAIEHYEYCPRQCALMYVEQTYEDNLYTVKGTLAHERVHSGLETESAGVECVRAIPLWSERLGLRGKADMVEFRADGPYPVEYKVGKRRGLSADLQLCGQAMCLEEMLGVAVPRGAVYYFGNNRRYEIVMTEALRQRTEEVIESIRAMLVCQAVPGAPNDSRCPSCSLLNVCLPWVVGEPARLRGLQGALFRWYELEADDE